MTVSVVDLPLDELIHCEAFARAIARAIHPVPEEGASGMACVTGKLVAPDLRKASPQTELLDSVRADIAGTFQRGKISISWHKSRKLHKGYDERAITARTRRCSKAALCHVAGVHRPADLDANGRRVDCVGDSPTA
jgi:hypothetical protein